MTCELFFVDRFKAAKRDNDCVYFEKVPALASLPAVQGRSLRRRFDEIIVSVFRGYSRQTTTIRLS